MVSGASGRKRSLLPLPRTRTCASESNASSRFKANTQCGQPMQRHDAESVSWTGLQARVARYRCKRCKHECWPLLDLLGVEPGRISGSLARLLALLAVVAPYPHPLAPQLAWLLLGVEISAMGFWKVVQRLGESAARYSDALSLPCGLPFVSAYSVSGGFALCRRPQ